MSSETTTGTGEPQEALDGLDGFAPVHQQWRLRRMLLTNWGGFDGGPHVIDFDERPTLITGATGAGKSSVLDAWTAVLMSPVAAYNAASNDVSRRHPGARTPASYLHGKYDDRPGEGLATVPVVLRPGEQLGMLALEFASTAGGSYTIGRLLHVVDDSAPVSPHWFAYRGVLPPGFDWTRFAPHFSARRMDHALPGIQTFTTWKAAVQEAFLPNLGIGQHRDGRKALRLLHDIQRATPVSSVNELFQRQVLETPDTYARARTVVQEFDELIASHRLFSEINDKIAVLSPIRADKQLYDEAEASDELIATYGDLGAADTPFALWRLQQQLQVLDEGEEQLVAQRDLAAQALAHVGQRAERLEADSRALDAAWYSGGGARLDAIDGELVRVRREITTVQERCARLTPRIAALGALPRTEQAWVELVTRAEQVLAEAEQQRRVLDERVAADLVAARRAGEERDRITGEVAQREQMRNNIPERLLAAREQCARAVGMGVEELPFAGELLDLAPGQEQWRTAANAVMASFATQLLVPAARRGDFRRAVDGLRLETRLRFLFVDPDAPLDEVAAPEGSLAARIVTRSDSVFAPWLRAEVDARFPHLCVAGADELVDDELARVTRTGQERRGDRGAHGGVGHVLGFTNEEVLAQLRAQLARAEEQVGAAEQRWRASQAEQQAMAARLEAARTLTSQAWADHDLPGVVARRDELERERAELLHGDQALDALQQQMEAKRRAASAATEERGRAAGTHQAAQEALEALRSRKEPVVAAEQRLVAAGVQLSPAQSDDLTRRLADDLAGQEHPGEGAVSAALVRITRQMEAEQKAATKDKLDAQARLEAVFREYCKRWPAEGAELSRSVEGAEDYLQILDTLEATGVADQRRDWADLVRKCTAQHVSALLREFDEASLQISSRLAPVQQVLDTVAFGPEHHRLVLHARHVPDAEVRTFTRALAAAVEQLLASTADLDDEASLAQAEVAFGQITRLLDKVRPETASADRLLDVRSHHHFTAREDDADGNPVAQFDSLAGKSGGETQELVAFITGAALRYQLGDDSHDRPTFAPVLLDEAFIKADSSTAHRGIAALIALGFQPVVVAPEGSFHALEPHFDQHKLVVKAEHRSAVIDIHTMDSESRTAHGLG